VGFFRALEALSLVPKEIVKSVLADEAFLVSGLIFAPLAVSEISSDVQVLHCSQLWECLLDFVLVDSISGELDEDFCARSTNDDGIIKEQLS